MTRNIDELSNLTTQKAEPPKEYFGKMDLNEEQVEKRLQYTKKANELFDVILILLLTMNERGETNFFYAKSLLESWILSLVAEFTTPDDYLMDYATDTAYNFVDTTNNHIDEPWYTSSDRALYNAENGANDVLNYTEYKEAIEAGKTEKRWITEKDNRVRKSHKAVTQKPIPILEYFRVGMAQMRFPKDYELAAAFPEELVNCRCTIQYLPLDKDEYVQAGREDSSAKANENTTYDMYQLAKQGNVFVSKTDKMYEYSKKIKPLKGYEDIVVHGDEYGLVFKDSNGVETNVSAVEFADMLEKSKTYHVGDKIRLISCSTGAGKGIVPTYLAKRFNTEVLAPTEIVNVDFEGNMVLANSEKDAMMGIETGEWALFNSEGRIR